MGPDGLGGLGRTRGFAWMVRRAVLTGQRPATPGLRGRATLGRSTRCHIVLTDERALRQHARVRLQGGTWSLEDLGSTNGTHLKVEPCVTHHVGGRPGSTGWHGADLPCFHGEYGGRDVDASDLPRFDDIQLAQERRLHPLVLWMAAVVAVLLLLIVVLMVVSIVAT